MVTPGKECQEGEAAKKHVKAIRFVPAVGDLCTETQRRLLRLRESKAVTPVLATCAVDSADSVSYTHLTLPTIYAV